MELYLNSSHARRTFKLLLGNANHLIITALVGLDAVERRVITEIPDGIHAAWTPKDPVASARRSRRLLLDMALIRAVDALDIYIKHSNRKPFLIEDVELRNRIDGEGRSIFWKFTAITDYHNCLDPVLCALIKAMIAWRNKSAHEEADIELDNSVKAILQDNDKRISTEYRGLDSKRLISGFENNRPPTFKEIASFIKATQDFVKAVDAVQLRACQPERYLKEHIWEVTGGSRAKSRTTEAHRKEHFQSVWGRDASERVGAVVRFLRATGLSGDPAKHEESPMLFDAALLNRVGAMKPSDAYKWANPR